MGTTSMGLPYPDPDDRVVDGAAAIQALAEQSEIVFGPTDWTLLTPASGYETTAGWFEPAYRVVDNMVEMRGRVSKTTGNIADGAQILATLPAGAWPSANVSLPVVQGRVTAGEDVVGRFDIAVDGTMDFYNGQPIGTDALWVSLDGVRYSR